MQLVRKSLLICFALVGYTAGVANAEATLLSRTSFSDAVPGGWADSVVAQSDGKIIAGGLSHSPVLAPVLVRFNVDGSLDESFGFHGRVIECDHGVSTAIALLPDGRILFANGRNSTVPLHLYRFLPDGSRDPSFGSGGMVSGPSGVITSVALQPDGKIVLAGSRNNDVLVVRLLADGSPDPAFGNAGIVTTSVTALPDRAEALRLQPDNSITIATQQFAVVRFLQDGSLDPSFGASGIASIDTSGLSASSSDLAIQPDGGIVVVGRISNRFGLVRYTALGALDTDFGNAGVVVSQIGSGRSEAHAVALTADGIVVGGQADATVNGEPVTAFALARYLDDGTLDSNFADDGVALTISNGYATILALALSGDDIVAAGNLDLREDLYTSYSNSELAVLRYGSTGIPDSTFDPATKANATASSGVGHAGARSSKHSWPIRWRRRRTPFVSTRGASRRWQHNSWRSPMANFGSR